MSALKSHDLISLQSIVFLEESTDSFSADKPISMASKHSEKWGGSAFIKRKTLNSQEVLWEELRTLKRKICWYQTETNHFYLKKKVFSATLRFFFCDSTIYLRDVTFVLLVHKELRFRLSQKASALTFTFPFQNIFCPLHFSISPKGQDSFIVNKNLFKIVTWIAWPSCRR